MMNGVLLNVVALTTLQVHRRADFRPQVRLNGYLRSSHLLDGATPFTPN